MDADVGGELVGRRRRDVAVGRKTSRAGDAGYVIAPPSTVVDGWSRYSSA
jgi:hypothetical protein